MIGHSLRSVCVNPRRKRPRWLAIVCAAAIGSGAVTMPAGAEPGAAAPLSNTWYERSFIVAADSRCRLFTPALGAALSASALQARGAAARAGVADEALADIVQRARSRAAATACSDPQLAVVRDRVVSAYSAWAGLRRMEFPGDRGVWKADRTAFETAGWRLMQTTVTGATPVSFGLVAGGDQTDTVSVVVSFVGRSRPYAVRVVMRDVERAPHPWLKAGRADLPPETARRAFFAAGNLEADTALLAPDHRQGEVWLFRSDIAETLAGLDPREPFVVEFLFRDDSVARARFEAGDFAAGRAFTAMGPI